MGNILCKNRTSKTATARAKSPVDRICPQGIGKKKYFWEKQILETSPSPSQHQIDEKDGWLDASLTVPANNQNIKEIERPVPPPRKKRSSKAQKDEQIKNGFEDLFLGDKENTKSKSLSNINNSNHNEKPSPTTNSLSKLNTNIEVIEVNNKTAATSLPRKISKVGNKKSDKFFGENLSDCLSDEIVPTTKNTTEHSHVKNSLDKNNEDDLNSTLQTVNLNDENEIVVDVNMDEDELLRQINKERGKLMFSIEKQIDKRYDDEERFKGAIPVEEEIIVPVKKITKHICDSDEEIPKYVHMHDQTDYANISGPKKPQRDFAKYKKPLKTKDKTVSSQTKNQLISEHNKNVLKCNSETQTGKGYITNGDHTATTKTIDQVTEQAKLAINDILKSAEAAVEKQKNSELLKENKNTSINDEKNKEHLNRMSNVTPEDLKLDNCEENNSNTKSPIPSNIETSSPDLLSPEIKIVSIINNNILADGNHEIELEVSQSSIRPTRTSEIVPPNLSNSEKILRRCLSTQSYLTSDLIEKIALQANILSLPDSGFSPEDALQCNDGSGLVSPNFKLDQKRSLSPQISTTSDKLDSETKTMQKLDSTENLKNYATELDKSITHNVTKLSEKIKNETNSIENHFNNSETITDDKNVPVSKVEKRIIRTPSRQLSKDNSIANDNESKKEVSECIRNFINNKNMKPQQILDLLQYEFGDCIFSKCLSSADKLIIEDLERSVQESKLNKSPTPTELKSPFKFVDKKHAKSPEKHKISKIPVLANKNVENVSFNDKRRHSIDDLNAWFTPEKDFPLRKRKREASLPGSLDNPELFTTKGIHTYCPKKSVLIEQENEESMEKSAKNLVDDILDKAEKELNNKNYLQTGQLKIQHQFNAENNGTTLSENSQTNLNDNSKILAHIVRNSESDEDDHSALLKFLEHEKTNIL